MLIGLLSTELGQHKLQKDFANSHNAVVISPLEPLMHSVFMYNFSNFPYVGEDPCTPFEVRMG